MYYEILPQHLQDNLSKYLYDERTGNLDYSINHTGKILADMTENVGPRGHKH